MTNQQDEWGPWIEHDGQGCPCKGMFVQTVIRCGSTQMHIAHGTACFMGRIAPLEHVAPGSDCWVWGSGRKEDDVIRYRIRKPRGLTILEEVARNVPQKVGK